MNLINIRSGVWKISKYEQKEIQFFNLFNLIKTLKKIVQEVEFYDGDIVNYYQRIKDECTELNSDQN